MARASLPREFSLNIAGKAYTFFRAESYDGYILRYEDMSALAEQQGLATPPKDYSYKTFERAFVLRKDVISPVGEETIKQKLAEVKEEVMKAMTLMAVPRFIVPIETEIACDCGGEKARTTHSVWCSKGNL